MNLRRVMSLKIMLGAPSNTVHPTRPKSAYALARPGFSDTDL